jgi:hypothetical protein
VTGQQQEDFWLLSASPAAFFSERVRSCTCVLDVRATRRAMATQLRRPALTAAQQAAFDEGASHYTAAVVELESARLPRATTRFGRAAAAYEAALPPHSLLCLDARFFELSTQRALSPPGQSDHGASGIVDVAMAAKAARLMALVLQRGAASEDALLASEVDSACFTAYRRRWRSTRMPVPPVHIHAFCLRVLLGAHRSTTLSLAECGGIDFFVQHIARLFGHLRAMEKWMRVYPDAVPPGRTDLSHQRFQFVDLHEGPALGSGWTNMSFGTSCVLLPRYANSVSTRWGSSACRRRWRRPWRRRAGQRRRQHARRRSSSKKSWTRSTWCRTSRAALTPAT